MKLIIIALIRSLIILLIYLLTVATIGFVKTLIYQPTINFNKSSASLPNTVTFGTMDMAFPYQYTFITVTIIFHLILRFKYNLKKIA